MGSELQHRANGHRRARAVTAGVVVAAVAGAATVAGYAAATSSTGHAATSSAGDGAASGTGHDATSSTSADKPRTRHLRSGSGHAPAVQPAVPQAPPAATSSGS